MTNFVPSPWVMYERPNKYIIQDYVGYAIAEVSLYPRNKPCSDATARLITVAPNMYELLTRCIDVVPDELSSKIQQLMSEVAGDD